MQDDEGQAQPFGALELVHQGVHGPGPLTRVRRRQVDEVVRVGALGSEPRGGQLPAELDDLGLLQGRAGPAQLVLQEDLDDAAPDRHAAAHRVWQAAGDRHVRPEVVAGRGVGSDSCPRRAQWSFLTSARTLSGSGSSPRPYRSTKRITPCLSMTNVAR